MIVSSHTRDQKARMHR